ncbi:MAG TPA: A24 family peptidase [Nitrososphaerales archaeon]|nr:A24 family peptidase [Nitrososphaerales archaeon]
MYSQILICVSLVVASYQDIKERAVSDIVWLPALAGAAYAFYSLYPAIEFLAVKVALVGSIALAFTLLGYMGQADGIAFAFIAADPFPLSPIPPLFGTALVTLVHIGYEYAWGDARGTLTIPIERFLKEQKWIPKAVISNGSRREIDRDVNVARDLVAKDKAEGAMVEVTYGVPTVAYLGIGYLVFLVYLLVFNQAAFLALP